MLSHINTQVWSWCTKFKEPKGTRNWAGTACVRHEFGRDLKKDLAMAANADVLVSSELQLW